MKRILLFCCTLFLSLFAYAQLDLTLEGQKMVRNALTDGIVLVRQSYVLENSNQEQFGIKGHDYFGRVLGVGLITDGGLVVPATTAKPWLNDEAYIKFRDNKEYSPKLSTTEIRYANKASFEKIAEKGTNYVFNRDSSIACTAMPHQDITLQGFTTKEETLNGWLVLLTTTGNVENEDPSTLSVDALKYSVSFDNKSNYCPIEETSTMRAKHVLGGAFFMPNYTMGQITFKYVGILVRNENGWILVKTDKVLTNSKTTSVESSVDTLIKLAPKVESDTLVPVSGTPEDTVKSGKPKGQTPKKGKGKTPKSQEVHHGSETTEPGKSIDIEPISK